MFLINEVGLNTSVSYVNQQKTSKQKAKNVSFQCNSENIEKSEKKNSRKLLKALIVAGLVVGGYLLFKKRSVIGDKLKNLFDKLKNKSGEVTTSSGVRQEQAVSDVVNPDVSKPVSQVVEDIKPFRTSAKEIDLNLGVDKPFKSAKESVAVFEEYGLTQTEKALNKADMLKLELKNKKVPSRREVIDIESSTLPNHKLRGKDYARKARNNKHRIIDEAQSYE